jgi:hypothetical protein
MNIIQYSKCHKSYSWARSKIWNRSWKCNFDHSICNAGYNRITETKKWNSYMTSSYIRYK